MIEPKDINVLIACEESQEVCKAFRARGFNAFSCDIQDCSGGHPEWHIQGDAIEVCESRKWDLIIAHPPCTRLANSGVLRLYKNGKKVNGIDPEKWVDMINGAIFFKLFLNMECDHIAVENPVMHCHAQELIGVKQTQSIQPYDFGDDASKRTCLWLTGLPKLKGTSYCKPKIVDGKRRWANQSPSGNNNLGKGKAKERSKTYKGFANAMADQWGNYLLNTLRK